MRINIHVPVRDEATIASSSRLDLSKIPLPLVELAKSSSVHGASNGSGGEMAMIELQGTLEIDEADPEGGEVLGRLEFQKGREDKPTLLVSHHRLEGQIVTLPKPFVVLERKQRCTGARDVLDTKTEHAKRRGAPRHRDLPSSPSRFQAENQTDTPRGRWADEEARDAPPDSPTIGRKRTLDKAEQLLRSSPPADATLSSSPMPLPRAMRGSEVDYSSPVQASKRQKLETNLPANGQEADEASEGHLRETDDATEDEWLYKRDSATFFDVVCIIRKKILFSKRPEPVVRLDGDGAEEARAAIGRSLAV